MEDVANFSNSVDMTHSYEDDFFERIIPDDDIRMLICFSHQHIVSIIDTLYKYHNKIEADNYIVILLWNIFLKNLKRIEWLNSRIGQIVYASDDKDRRDDFMRLLQPVYKLGADFKKDFDEINLDIVLSNWQKLRDEIMSLYPTTDLFGMTLWDEISKQGKNQYIVEMCQRESENISRLTNLLDIEFAKYEYLHFISKTGELEFRNMKKKLVKPDTIQWIVLRLLVRSRGGCVKVKKANEVISDFLEQKAEADVTKDATKSKSFYNAKDEINKRFRKMFEVDFNLIEMANNSYSWAKIPEIKMSNDIPLW